MHAYMVACPNIQGILWRCSMCQHVTIAGGWHAWEAEAWAWADWFANPCKIHCSRGPHRFSTLFRSKEGDTQVSVLRAAALETSRQEVLTSFWRWEAACWEHERQRSFPWRMASAVILVAYGAELSTTSVKQIQRVAENRRVAERPEWNQDWNRVMSCSFNEIGAAALFVDVRKPRGRR